MPPSCSAVGCVLDSIAQTAGQSQSEQRCYYRVVQTQSLTRHWSGQSVSVTADVHQYVAEDNSLGLQVQAAPAADESDSKHDTVRQ